MHSVVDLFCGVGGLTHGFIKEGFHVAAGIDLDPTCEYAYTRNNKGTRFLRRDVAELTTAEVAGLYPEGAGKILVGCAPCQPFSQYNNRKAKDENWRLLESFAELIARVEPEIVSMENVPQLEDHEVFYDFLAALKESEYDLSWYIVDCVRYGIPQTRTRLVLFATRNKGMIKIVPPTHGPSRFRTVRHVIQRLEPIRAGGASEKDPIHRASGLSELNLRRIQHTPEGGGWRDWDDDLVLECHRKETGRSYGSVYGRMVWDAPAPTMTTQCHGYGNGRFGHPHQDRAISLREAAMFQTFPRSYKFARKSEDVMFAPLARHIGNAVPVRLGRIIARSIRKHLENSLCPNPLNID